MSKKGENIYKRKDGRWEARYAKSRLDNNKIKYGYCYGKTYREAKEKAQTAKLQLFCECESESIIDCKSVSDFCDEWLKVNKNKIKESTFVKYSSALEKYIKPQLGFYSVTDLTALTLEKFSSELIFKNDLSAKTVRDILTLLKSILKYSAKQNTDFIIPEIIYPKVEAKEISVLSVSEQSELIQYLSSGSDKKKLGVLLSLLTGLRVGEICALKCGDISIQNKTIKISSTMQRIKDVSSNSTKTKIIISSPKSTKSIRIIPLSGLALKLCEKLKTDNDNAFLLTGQTESFIEPRSMQNALKRYAKDCGICKIHFHTLRHTFATRCVEVGFEIKSLSEILGHSSIQVTLDRYVHSSIELKRQNMNKLLQIGF